MDTPKGKQIETVISHLEDSPVFAYINGLSPLKPVKSTPFGQRITWLGSFSSPPSVFTSPGSRKQVGLLERRHCFLEPSKPEVSAANGNENIRNTGVLDTVQVSNCSAYPQELFDPGGSIGKAVANPYNDSSDISVELQQELKYDCGSSDSNPVPSLAIVTDPLPDVAGTLASLDHHVQDISIENGGLNETKVKLAVICQQDQTKGGRGHGKEKLATDVLTIVTEIPKGQNQEQVDSGTRSFSFHTSNLPRCKIDNPKKRKVDDPIVSCEQHEVERPLSQLVALEKRGTDHSGDTVSNSFNGAQVVNEPNEKARNGIPVAHNPDLQQQHGIQRRSLVFEISTTHKITLEYGSNSSSITSKFDDKQLVPFKPILGSSPYTPPGIGLHSNALEAAAKNCEVVKHETLASGGKISGTTSSIASFNCLSSEDSEQKPINETLAQNSTGKMGCAGNEVLVVKDASQSPFRFCEEFNQGSRKKRKRHAYHFPTSLAEFLFPNAFLPFQFKIIKLRFHKCRHNVKHDGEREGCKGCSCRSSKCLKLYCNCFATGIYCMELCSCRECFNKPPHEDTVLDTRKKIESRDPLAFSPKVIWSSESTASTAAESDRTLTSARHMKGCKCKKSRCLKKYCECYQGGARCSISCRCLGCENGRNGVEIAEQKEEETGSSEKNRIIESLPNSVAQKSEEHYSDHIPPQTPSFHICRPLFQLPCSSGAKAQRSEYSIGPSALPLTKQTIESDSGRPLPKFKFHFQITPVKGTPEILSENSSLFTPTKTSSPNSKRVTPPRNGFGLSLNRRTSRKLVLQSTTSTRE